jgi:phosphoribosyl 1,2-cyclic phosphodiesterase
MRDALAAKLDRPPFKVLDDDRLIEIAKAVSTTAAHLAAIGLTAAVGEPNRHCRTVARLGKPLVRRVPVPPDEQIQASRSAQSLGARRAADLDVESDVVLPASSSWRLLNRARSAHHSAASPWRLERYADEIIKVPEDRMRLNFHGAAQTVTGSQHLLEINGSRLLLDCGLYQGRREESYARNRNFAYDPRTVDAVILSHAHIDHCGNLPNLVKQGFSGRIFATRATADLGDIMLRDAGHIQESDAEFLNKKNRGNGPQIEPLYTMADAEQVAGHFFSVDYGQRFEPVPGVIAQFFDAGHILGSAGVLLQLNEKDVTCVSGSRGYRPAEAAATARSRAAAPVDYLLMECTYGDKPHNDPQRGFRRV